MFTALTITNLFTDDDVDLYDPEYEVNYFQWNYVTSGEDSKRGQSAGRWKNFKTVEYMAIDIRGAVIDDDVTAWWASAMALAAAVIVDAESDTRDHVRIEMTADDGSDTKYYADCVLDTYSLPKEALAPAVAKFEFAFDCRDGYWRKSSDDSIARLP